MSKIDSKNLIMVWYVYCVIILVCLVDVVNVNDRLTIMHTIQITGLNMISNACFVVPIDNNNKKKTGINNNNNNIISNQFHS